MEEKKQETPQIERFVLKVLLIEVLVPLSRVFPIVDHSEFTQQIPAVQRADNSIQCIVAIRRIKWICSSTINPLDSDL